MRRNLPEVAELAIDSADWCRLVQDCYAQDGLLRTREKNEYGSIKGTAKTAEGPACKDTLDELLIGAVKERRALYDYTIPASQRTNLRKNALWLEVSNLLGGALGPEEAKARWKYLRDNYAKARKKAKAYIPSGSAAKIGGLKKSKFRFYDLMTFLNDFLETRQTVSSLPDVTESQVYATSTQYEDDSVASSSQFTDIPSQTAIHTSPTMQTPIRVSPKTPISLSKYLVSPRISTEDSVSPEIPPALSKTSPIPATNSKRPLQTADYDLDKPPRQTAAKKKQKGEDLQTALIKALKEDDSTVEPAQTTDPLDGFLIRLGEGMRRLPYRDRARLEIRFLTLLAETEDSCENKKE
ncbi:uncharacterized protein LOC112454480 isoform X2 [Temnothorax curvispinosus]|uniref:Uncharacterized protein LOC112454480 isoform X2 n=1 Tax=Temnothorax curvispinosus TaxID=300111 RepID=A0A6J1PPN4_9HYME|nr:uncharacterized protein LOC112454480 isoform X2 [Temnothorax curvispinosus]